ncbi:glycosyltransferase family 4 protein [Flavivirga rizhaonensis]|uniref:Glycosyltransferase n=1 Tax=Flavivirga rizhaonensis TaxID=2559571 RepID=A0A4S1E1F3_9FLAO|nr:glycosyltransferase [Flavivirga rizhaonensis]TGV04436.1 glycosyltransferase [Flavivirga rizhaonensis]
MKFTIITHVEHKSKEDVFYAYAPYVREMNLWLKHIDELEIVAPLSSNPISKIDISYKHQHIIFRSIPSIEFTSVKTILTSIIKIPVILFQLIKAFQKTDHIHLRCPGNIGLLGCIIQFFFPKKTKTAKYAGNWDPKSKQSFSYRLQKWLLSNTFLTRNITVLVYGQWKNQTKNIKSFFTATYSENEISVPKSRNYSKALKFIFLGSLVEGKRPLLVIKIIEALYKKGKEVSLEVYGEGVLSKELEDYIVNNNLEKRINLHGNREKNVIKNALKEAHFLILPSKSEGWPKAVAEAMFFGVIPISTLISCVPYMLDHGSRGILIESSLDKAVKTIEETLNNGEKYLEKMSLEASIWSQNYTLEAFETEIKELLF